MLKPYTFAIRTSQRCNQKLQKSMSLPTLKTKLNEESQQGTMCISNSGLSDKTKV